MYRILNCLTTQHDPRLVLLAAVVCAVAIVTTFKTYAHALDSDPSKKLIWLLLTAFCAASGIWATHFLAMLAYDSGTPVSYDPLLTAASLVVAIAVSCIGFYLCAGSSRWRIGAGGAVIGIGIGMMHFIGMWALVVGGTIEWNLPFVVSSIVVGIAFATAAMVVYHALDRGKAIWTAAALLILGICGLHFTAMSAVTIVPDPTIAIEFSTLNTMALAVIVTSVALLVMVAGGVTVLIDKLKAQLAEHVLKLERAHEVSTAAQAEKETRIQSARAEAELHDAERNFQEELGRLVEAALTGDFSRRVDLAGKTGITSRLGEGLNCWADSISNAISQVKNVLASLAAGDLSKRMEGNYQGDLARLQMDVNTMADKIRSIARRISGVSGEVQGATREIASGVADLSARTEHQASSLEETSASMEQLATTVRQNAGNAQEANRLASAASSSAVSGGDIANRAVTAMGRIEESSRQITDIVGLIQDIAFQTNLLALNAAVEPPALVRPARALPLSPMKCVPWHNAPGRPPRTSRG